MFKKTKEFLFVSVSCLVILCVVIFLWIGSTMSGKSLKAINEIGKLYMSEMSKQLQQKFDAIISLQISQLEGVVKRTPPETVSYGEDMLEELALSAEVRQFVHLGLYRKD
ncbi:MAG: response regulator, partial [Lachnospiraceae bacterium]|nr:response regulator [Lachnospiraceae bacterium]